MDDIETIPGPRDLLAANNSGELRRFCESEHAAIVADRLAELNEEEVWGIIKTTKPERQAEIVSHLPIALQSRLILSLQRSDAGLLLVEMPPDDRAGLFRQLDEEQRERIYPSIATAEREDIRRLTAHPADSAGSVMSSDYVALERSMTVAEALHQIRLEAPEKEIVYYVYVLDKARRLIGLVSLKNLIIAKENSTIEELMRSDFVTAHVTDDKETAARKIQKFDLIALPVVNDENVLVGIITHDDALDVITQEQQEDLEKLMAISGSHDVGTYLQTPALVHFKNRAYWVVGLAALGLVSGLIIHSFEDSLAQLMILALYMPMVADTGGNTGSQSATVVVRGLALGEIRPRDIFRVLFKELRVSLLLALVLAVLSFGKVLFLSHGADIPPGFTIERIASVIALSLGMQVVTATLIGAWLPMIASKFKLDPAVVASPALTTIVDITGLLLYFTAAKMMLGI
tara:strand:- start:44498 stop:45877 length:1380 start_codon:yes stop_codon:yes gene_type:complete